jgi:hypothetical protein
MIKMKAASFVVIGTLVATWWPCASVLAETGQVIDRISGKPLANVFVIAQWNGTLDVPLQPKSTCYHAELALTDNEGRYHLPDFSWNFNPFLRNRHRTAYPYKAGYEESSIPRPNESVIFMEARVGSKSEMFRAVERNNLSGGCNESESRFSVPRKVRLMELMSLAESPKEFDIADSQLFALESSEVGYPAADRNLRRRQLERGEAKKKEELK